MALADSGPPIELDTIYIEERRDGRVVWSARAPTAQGSAQQANVTELELHVSAADEDGDGLRLFAKAAELMLESGEMFLHDIEGHSVSGMRFATDIARFSRHTQALVCEKPVQLDAPLGSLSATGAALLWAAGEIDFYGPVTGQYRPGKPPSAPP